MEINTLIAVEEKKDEGKQIELTFDSITKKVVDEIFESSGKYE